jgi:hypothetical protein
MKRGGVLLGVARTLVKVEDSKLAVVFSGPGRCSVELCGDRDASQ